MPTVTKTALFDACGKALERLPSENTKIFIKNEIINQTDNTCEYVVLYARRSKEGKLLEIKTVDGAIPAKMSAYTEKDFFIEDAEDTITVYYLSDLGKLTPLAEAVLLKL